ncbi:MAG TPA: DUF3239 domain-containing protein [Abditibacteriaceae bacterium]|jgi:hypothetical protein
MPDSASPDSFPRSLTVDNNTQASNPGGVRVRWMQFFRAFPQPSRGTALALIVLLNLALRVHWIFWVPFVLTTLASVWALVRVRDHFRHGNLLPAVVVSQQPPRIAALTDLSKGIGQFNAVKIVEQPLAVCDLHNAPVGTRTAVIALYTGDNNDVLPHWVDFDPVLINAATRDERVRNAALTRLEESDFEELERALQTLPEPLETRLYALGWNLPPDDSKSTTTQVDFAEVIDLKPQIHLVETDGGPKILVIQVSGEFHVDSGDADYLLSVKKAALAKFSPDGLILDFYSLSFDKKNAQERLPGDDGLNFWGSVPTALVYGPLSKAGLGAAAFGGDSERTLDELDWMHSSEADAVQWLRERINSLINTGSTKTW